MNTIIGTNQQTNADAGRTLRSKIKRVKFARFFQDSTYWKL